MTQHFTINPTQRLTPTGRKAITQSKIEGLNQDKSTISCVNRRVLHMLKPKHTAPGTPVADYRWSNIDSVDAKVDLQTQRANTRIDIQGVPVDLTC